MTFFRRSATGKAETPIRSRDAITAPESVSATRLQIRSNGATSYDKWLDGAAAFRYYPLQHYLAACSF